MSEVAPATAPVETTETAQAEVKPEPKKPSHEETIYQKAKAADQKFREAAEMRKTYEAHMKKLQEDPESFFNDPSIPKQKRREMAEKMLLREIEEELQPQLTAEQREIEELRGYKKAKEGEELSAKEQEEKAQFQQVVTKRQEELASVFKKALELSPLSKDEATSAEVVRDMALYMRLCKQAGYEPSPEEIATHVESRFMNSFQGLAASLEGEDLVKLLGKDILKKLRKYDLGQLESRMPKREPVTANEWRPREEQSGKRSFASPKELERMIRGK